MRRVCDTAVSHFRGSTVNRWCKVCGGKLESSRAKTCSERCRKKLSRRRDDTEHRMLDVREKLRKLSQAYQIGAIDTEHAVAYVDFVQRELDRIKMQIKIDQQQGKIRDTRRNNS